MKEEKYRERRNKQKESSWGRRARSRSRPRWWWYLARIKGRKWSVLRRRYKRRRRGRRVKLRSHGRRDKRPVIIKVGGVARELKILVNVGRCLRREKRWSMHNLIPGRWNGRKRSGGIGNTKLRLPESDILREVQFRLVSSKSKSSFIVCSSSCLRRVKRP